MNLVQKLVWTLQRKLPTNSLRRRFASGAFWSLLGTAVLRGSNLAAGVVIARFLGTRQYGELGIIITTVAMFTAYAGLRLGLLASREVAVHRNRDPARAGRIIGLSGTIAMIAGGAVTAAAVALAPWLARRVMDAPHLTDLLRLGALSLFFEGLWGAQLGALTGMEAFRATAQVSIARGVVGLPVMVLCTWWMGLRGAVLSYLIMSVVGWGAMAVALRVQTRRAGIRIGIRGVRQDLPLVWRFALPAFLGGILLAPTVWAASSILANQPRGYEELGLFNAARQWWALLLFLPQILSQVVVPIMTERFSASDHRSMRKVLLATSASNALTTVPLALGLTALAPYVMGLYGEGFEAGAWTLALMVWAAAITAIQQPVAQVIVASARMWLSFLLNLSWAAILLATFYFLRHLGSFGLGLSFVIAYLGQLGLSVLLAFRLTRDRGGFAPQPYPQPPAPGEADSPLVDQPGAAGPGT